jgi:diguanylate cyclase (GGDEF)-like protein
LTPEGLAVEHHPDRHRILLVDDSRLGRAALGGVLVESGYQELIEAPTASEALHLLGVGNGRNVNQIDLVLLDFVLPDMDGIQACRIIRDTSHLADLPIIMATASHDPQVLKEAFAAGARDFLYKPVTPVELLARVRSALDLKTERDRRKSHQAELVRINRELGRLNDQLRKLTHLDGLTGVANRRYYDMRMEQEWRRCQRASKPLAAVMMDIDHFKAYNDHYGHQQGDVCLRAVAKALQDGLKRPGDLLARYGGEEFVALLPETGTEGAANLAQTLRGAVAALNLGHAKSPVADHVTISLGVASLIPPDDLPREHLVSLADQALYQAKSQGRDRVVASPTRSPQGEES